MGRVPNFNSRIHLEDDTSDLDVKRVWDWALRQEERVYEEFGLGIVGIGALYFAYGGLGAPGVKAIIAAVGLIGSIVLFLHIWGSGREYWAARKLLEKRHLSFLRDISYSEQWWTRGRISRYFFQPARRIMLILMGFVGGSWMILLTYRVYAFVRFGLESSLKSPELKPGFVALYYSMLVVISIGMLIVSIKKYQDHKRYFKSGLKIVGFFLVAYGAGLTLLGFMVGLIKPDLHIGLINLEVIKSSGIVAMIIGGLVWTHVFLRWLRSEQAHRIFGL